jgi:hypothetical protein
MQLDILSQYYRNFIQTSEYKTGLVFHSNSKLGPETTKPVSTTVSDLLPDSAVRYSDFYIFHKTYVNFDVLICVWCPFSRFVLGTA